MNVAKKNGSKKSPGRSLKSDKPPKLSVVTVRISNIEKERIDEIMRRMDIKRYSDVMRMALQLVKRQQPLVF